MSKLFEVFQKTEVPLEDERLHSQLLSDFLEEKGLVDEFEEFIKAYIKIHPEKIYDKNYGDDLECTCGHPYYRHFDSYEDMLHVGCKYCGCYDFVLNNEGKINLTQV